MTTPSMSEAEKIAAGLTEAQREAVLAIHGSEWRSWSSSRLGHMWHGLGKHGLTGLRDAGLAQKGPPWYLTRVGLAVRDHIIGSAAAKNVRD